MLTGIGFVAAVGIGILLLPGAVLAGASIHSLVTHALQFFAASNQQAA